MQRNAKRCAHCGESFVPVENVPFINRTDRKTFHVTLFAGPNPRPTPSGGFFARQRICSFWYVHNQLGPKRRYVVVYIPKAEINIEDAADLVADLVQAGQKLRGIYTVNDSQLTPGLPT